MQNAKDYYRDNQNHATITYAWFSARVKALYAKQGKDTKSFYRTGNYYMLNPNQKRFKALLTRCA